MTNFAKYTLLGFVLVLTQPGLSYKLTGIKEDVNSDVAMEKILLNPRLRPSLKKPDHPVPTYFHKRTKDGEFVDRLGKDYGAEISLPRTEDLFVGQTGATINVNPLDDVPNGGAVEVSWKGVLQASNKDWLGYYCPKNDSSGHYLDYMLASKVAPETWMKGYGSFSVRLYNMRVDCEFRYYRSNNKTVLMGRSASVKFRNGPEAPLQARISMTRNPTEMRIMWSSGYVDKIMVKYGLSEDDLKFVASGESTTYAASDMCEAPATTTGFWDPGYMHDVLLQDLQPATKYYYSFGSLKAMSPVYNFTTPLPAGDPTPYNFIYYGDMGISDAGRKCAQNMIEDMVPKDIKHIFHNGDISYARGHAYIWEQWHDLIQPLATLAPYMVGIGNHEQDHLLGGAKDPSGAPAEGFHPIWGNFGADSGGECGLPMYKRFHMPDNGNKLWWYSYDYGLVHYIMMSTEHNFEPGSRQYMWLENDLKKVDRKKTPWVIIGGHRAMYASAMIWLDFIVSNHMKTAFEDLLHTYKVDVAFWAHYHSYERTCKAYDKKCADDGTVHIVAGTAGAGLDKKLWFEEDWSVKRINDHGYGRVFVANATAMYFEWISNKDKTVMDSFWLTK